MPDGTLNQQGRCFFFNTVEETFRHQEIPNFPDNSGFPNREVQCGRNLPTKTNTKEAAASDFFWHEVVKTFIGITKSLTSLIVLDSGNREVQVRHGPTNGNYHIRSTIRGMTFVSE